MKEAADEATTSAALQDEAATSSINPLTTTVAGVDPMHVELPRDEAIPATITGGAASTIPGRPVMSSSGRLQRSRMRCTLMRASR